MFKIKLLILLLNSFFLLSCIKNNNHPSDIKYSVSYIAGEYDGLILKNLMTSYLKSFGKYDRNSNLEIQSNISHSSDLFITNIDNTSDREKITTNLSIVVLDKNSNCTIYNNNFSISQFYIFATGDKFLSNQNAFKKIKKDNTEYLVKQLINKLFEIGKTCRKND